MDAILFNFEKNIAKKQMGLHEAQLSKIQFCSSESYVFKKKENEAQYKFNFSFLDELVSAFTHLYSAEPDKRFRNRYLKELK